MSQSPPNSAQQKTPAVDHAKLISIGEYKALGPDDFRYVQWLRGLIVEFALRKITMEEFAVWNLVEMRVDLATGIWIGSAGELSQAFRWSERHVLKILKSLEQKKYISLPEGHRRSPAVYPIQIVNYFVHETGHVE